MKIFNELKGFQRVGAIVALCTASQLFLSFLFAGSGFGGIWAFYAVPSVVFFLFFAGFGIKTLVKPADGKWLPGDPKYWFVILLGALLTGCALGFHWPTVMQLSSTTKLETVAELQGFPESIEFINGVEAMIPSPVTNTSIDVLGLYQQEFEERNTGSGNIPEKCFLAVGLGDLGTQNAPESGFSMTVGCEAQGRCTDVNVVTACLEDLAKRCSPCEPRGAIPVSQLPWEMALGPAFPQEAVDDFKLKNAISPRGFTHVQFKDFAGMVSNSENIMIGCGISGVVLTAVAAAFYALRERAKVEDGKTESGNALESGATAQIEVSKVPGMGYLE